jgi:hypothetical protein
MHRHRVGALPVTRECSGCTQWSHALNKDNAILLTRVIPGAEALLILMRETRESQKVSVVALQRKIAEPLPEAVALTAPHREGEGASQV